MRDGRRNQRPSDLARSRPSEVIRGHQRSLEVIGGRSSEVIGGNQGQLTLPTHLKSSDELLLGLNLLMAPTVAQAELHTGGLLPHRVAHRLVVLLLARHDCMLGLEA